MRSIRRDLISVLVMGTGLILVISGISLHALIKQSMLETFDEATFVKARAVAAMMEFTRGGLSLEEPEGLMSEFEAGDTASYYQLWLEDGQVIHRSPSLGDRDLPLPSDNDEAMDCFEFELPDGRWGRAAWLLVEPKIDADDDSDDDEVLADPDLVPPPKTDAELLGYEPPRIQVVVARSLEDTRSALAMIRGGLMLAGGLSGLAIVVLLLWAIPRRLRPVIQLGSRVQGIDATCLATRLSETDLPSELQELPKKINELLARLEESFDRERRMTANLAHDLRTPLAELRSAVEIARRWPEDHELNEQALETALSTSLQMTTLVTALLKLARIEANQATPDVESIVLDELLEQLGTILARTASERELGFERNIPEGLCLLTDRALLSLVLANLLENAVKYSPRASTIACTWTQQGDEAVWSLTNPAPELKPEDLSKLTEPFWQKDAARSRRGSAGLGLTLAQSIVSALGLRLSLGLGECEFTASLRFRSEQVQVVPSGSEVRQGTWPSVLAQEPAE